MNQAALHHPALDPVFDEFRARGFQLYYVGGCVRNAVLDRPASDIDLATDAHPATVRAIGAALGLTVVATGEAHGTLTLMINGTGYEVTTFRSDVSTDGRRATVAFSSSMEEDAKRRDFTMNALYADRDGTIIDPLGGLDDTTRQRIRFIGDPDDRIREDYLRILRFFRFYGWYGKSNDGIDADGLAACAALADGLDLVSNERVGSELLKLLSAPDPCPAMASMDASGVLSRILPGASAKSLPILHELETDLTPDPLRRLAILGGSNAKDNLRLSKAQAETLQNLTTHAQNTQSSLEMGYALGATRGIDAWIIRCAWLEHMPNQPDLDMIERGACATLPIQAGDITHWYSGRDLGNALKRAQVAWLDSGALMTKDQLIKMLTPG